MIRVRLCYGLMLALLAAGCGDSPDAKQSSKLRKDGDHEKALELVLQSLAESDRHLDVWREYAFCTMWKKDHSETDEASFSYLVQSAVLAATVITAGKGDHHWEGIANLASQAVRLDANDAMQQITIPRSAYLREDRTVDYPDDLDAPIPGVTRLQISSGLSDSRLLDFDAAEQTVRRCQFDYQLLTLLSGKKSESNNFTMKQLDEKFSDWGSYTELGAEWIEKVRAGAKKDFDNYFTPIQTDFVEDGHFSVAHIILQKLRP